MEWDRYMRRAGSDYHEYAQVRHADWSTFLATEKPDLSRMFAMTTRAASRCIARCVHGRGLAGVSETRGLNPALLRSFPAAAAVVTPADARRCSL